jgi:hypothetical protein
MKKYMQLQSTFFEEILQVVTLHTVVTHVTIVT